MEIMELLKNGIDAIQNMTPESVEATIVVLIITQGINIAIGLFKACAKVVGKIFEYIAKRKDIVLKRESETLNNNGKTIANKLDSEKVKQEKLKTKAMKEDERRKEEIHSRDLQEKDVAIAKAKEELESLRLTNEKLRKELEANTITNSSNSNTHQ